MSFDVILPFLRPIAHLIQDPDVSEIMVNGGGRVFLERQGRAGGSRGRAARRNGTCRSPCSNIARTLGDDVSEEQPDPRRALAGRLARGGGHSAVQPRRHDADDSQVPDAGSSPPTNWCESGR